MKKITLTIITCLLLTINYQAQSTLELEKNLYKTKLITPNDSIKPKDLEKNYNLWSINANFGTNLGIKPFSEGYYATTQNYFINPDLHHINFNVRKMFNTKFGISWDFAYDKFTSDNGSPYFSNNMYRTNIRGVLNMHRVMNWEQFTETFGLQFHLGTGFSFLQAPGTTKFNHYDNIFSILGGSTLLVKLNRKFMLSLDYTIISNLTHHVTLDGKTKLPPDFSRTGTVYTNSFGITYYFGKKEKHADWYYEFPDDATVNLLSKIEDLENQLENNNLLFTNKLEQLENQINNNTSIINNYNTSINGTDDDIELNNEQMKNMINGQYVNVFFDFDKTKISTGSISAINFLIKYLNANPNAKVDIIGYADELGDFDYNIDLSRRRAERVFEMVTRFGIDPSRLKLVYRGEDNSVPKESSLARQLVRRVSFEVYDAKEESKNESIKDPRKNIESTDTTSIRKPENSKYSDSILEKTKESKQNTKTPSLKKESKDSISTNTKTLRKKEEKPQSYSNKAKSTVVDLNYNPIEKGYYVIISVFEFQHNLKQFEETLQKNKVKYTIFKNLVNQKYYFSAGYFKTSKEAYDYKKNRMDSSFIKDSWVYQLK